MFLNPGGHRQDIWVENDIILIEANLIDKDPVSPLTDSNFLRIRCCLAVFIEGHDHHCRPVAHDVASLFLEILFALLERDRIHNSLPLQVFQAFLEDFPLRGIHHDRHLRHVRLALK